MAGRDTPKGPGAGGDRPNTLIEVAEMGYPFERILEEIVQTPSNSATDILNLGLGQNRAFRDRLRYLFSRSPNYALFRHLSCHEIRQLSGFMGDAVAANLREYTRQFPIDYLDLFDGNIVNTRVLEKILGDTEFLKHRYYREQIRRWMRPIFSTVNGLENMRVMRLMLIVGMPLGSALNAAIAHNNIEAARYAITEGGERVSPFAAYSVVMRDIHDTHPELFRLVAENVRENTDETIRDGMRRIVSWHGHPEFEEAITVVSVLMRQLIQMERDLSSATVGVEEIRQAIADTRRTYREYVTYLASNPE